MKNKKQNKVLYILLLSVSIVVIFTIMFIIHDKCCTPIASIYYQNSITIDTKYIYFYKENRYEGARFVHTCDRINAMHDYYYRDSVSIDFMNGYLEPFKKYEILDYYPSDSTAIVRIYNTIPRLNRKGFVIVSMRCLHDTLPSGIEENYNGTLYLPEGGLN